MPKWLRKYNFTGTQSRENIAQSCYFQIRITESEKKKNHINKINIFYSFQSTAEYRTEDVAYPIENH